MEKYHIILPKGVTRVVESKRAMFFTITSRDLEQETHQYREAQLMAKHARKARAALERAYNIHMQKAEGPLRLAQAILANLAQEENSRLLSLPENEQAQDEAETYIRRRRKETVEGLATLL